MVLLIYLYVRSLENSEDFLVNCYGSKYQVSSKYLMVVNINPLHPEFFFRRFSGHSLR